MELHQSWHFLPHCWTLGFYSVFAYVCVALSKSAESSFPFWIVFLGWISSSGNNWVKDSEFHPEGIACCSPLPAHSECVQCHEQSQSQLFSIYLILWGPMLGCWFEWASLEGASESYTFQEIHYYHTPQIYLEGYWSIVDLQSCVNFGRTAKGLIYVYINMPFPILFSCGLSQHVDYLSMCCTVRSCLFILYKVVCLC